MPPTNIGSSILCISAVNITNLFVYRLFYITESGALEQSQNVILSYVFSYLFIFFFCYVWNLLYFERDKHICPSDWNSVSLTVLPDDVKNGV